MVGARNVLVMRLCSAWGMTENGVVTVTEPSRAMEKSAISDGRTMTGMEVKVVDVNGIDLPPGESGALLVRGASMFGGYLKRPQLNATSADGWFDTGDVATVDAEGGLVIGGHDQGFVA